MPLSIRSRLSLAQFLGLQPDEALALVLVKHGMRPTWPPSQDVVRLCRTASDESLVAVLNEVACTTGDLRAAVNPKYRYDQRAGDLTRCLEMDGYQLAIGEGLRQIEPTVDGQVVYEDDLTRALRTCNLAEGPAVLAALEQSANAFRRQPPDFNAALTQARIALQTLATSIALQRSGGVAVGFDPTKWGQVAAYLRTSGFLTKAEEDGLTGAFSFVSPGAHQHIARSEEDMTRLGRSMVVSMCYFLAKTYAA